MDSGVREADFRETGVRESGVSKTDVKYIISGTLMSNAY